MYELTQFSSVRRLSDGLMIPTDPENRDYAQYLAWLSQGNRSEAQPEPSFADLQAAKIDEINAAFASSAQALTAGYSDAERLTWPAQQAEALAWGANNATATPYLDGIATARGIDAATMRQATLDQVNAFQAASQSLVGTRQKLRDQINAATTVEAVEAITWAI